MRVGELEAELAAIGGDKNGLAGALAEAEATVTQLREDAAVTAAATGGLDEQLNGLKEKLTASTAKLASVEEVLAAEKTAKSDLAAALSEAEAKVIEPDTFSDAYSC